MKKVITFLLMTACTVAAVAQQLTVQCQVNDSEGEGVPFATIFICNSNDTATVSDSNVSDAFGKIVMNIKNPAASMAMPISLPRWAKRQRH